MAWYTHAPTFADPETGAFSEDFQGLASNFKSMADGDPGAPPITDAALDSGTATAAGIAWAGKRTAGLAFNTVGSYALLSHQGTSVLTIIPGDVVNGANLTGSSAGGHTGGAVAGSWRAMGACRTDTAINIPPTDSRRVTLFVKLT